MFVQQGCYLQNISEYAMKRYLDFATFPLVEEKDLMMVVTEQLSILTLEFLLIKQLVQFSARGFNLRATGESQSFFWPLCRRQRCFL
mmetsp:Transcript_1409/g.2232  ORF Transcript_1409/g.2232 Transcript_1409/m.2232 type:complete len:87 (-) Transcript_1409:823-1083(-)